MTGWISLHRSIEKHWLYQEDRVFSKFEAWVDILLMVNHKDNKVFMNGQLVTVKRGQRITSLRKLAEKWNWSRTKVDSFLKILVQDDMLVVKKDTQKTLLTVVNYDLYQNDDLKKRHKKATQVTGKSHANDTQVTQKSLNNNVNKDNKENKDNNEKKINAFDFFQENGFGILNQYTAQDINHYIESFESNSDEIVQAALKIALDRNKISWGYAKSILNNWLNANLKSFDEIKAYERQQKAQRTNSRNQFKGSIQSKEITPDWLLAGKHKNRVGKNTNTSEQDEELEKDRKAFLQQLNNTWSEE